jgi:hypothetical protein
MRASTANAFCQSIRSSRSTSVASRRRPRAGRGGPVTSVREYIALRIRLWELEPVPRRQEAAIARAVVGCPLTPEMPGSSASHNSIKSSAVAASKSLASKGHGGVRIATAHTSPSSSRAHANNGACVAKRPLRAFNNTVARTFRSIRSARNPSARTANSSASRVSQNRTGALWRCGAVYCFDSDGVLKRGPAWALRCSKALSEPPTEGKRADGSFRERPLPRERRYSVPTLPDWAIQILQRANVLTLVLPVSEISRARSTW